MRNKKPVSANQVIAFIGKLIEQDLFVPGVGFARGVLEEDNTKKLIQETFNEHIKTALMNDEHDDFTLQSIQSQDRKLYRVIQWRYTPSNVRNQWYAIAAKKHHSRPFTLWLGQKLTDKILTGERDAAKLISKELNRKLSKLLGRRQYEFWFCIETTRESPDQLHLHGIMEVADLAWFENEKLCKKLRNAIREAVGTDPVRSVCTQLHMPEKVSDTNWITYCRKQRSSALRPTRHDLSYLGGRETATQGLRGRRASIHKDFKCVYNALLYNKFEDRYPTVRHSIDIAA